MNDANRYFLQFGADDAVEIHEPPLDYRAHGKPLLDEPLVCVPKSELERLQAERSRYLAALREIRVNIKHMQLRAKGQADNVLARMFDVLVAGDLQATAEALGIEEAASHDENAR